MQVTRFDVKLMGKLLGTATGWDGEMPTFAYYEFEPAEGIEIGPGCFQINYETGEGEIINDAGDVTKTYSLTINL